MLDEATYRQILKGFFDRIQRAFDDVDPDQAECAGQLGALTITLPNGAKCILSAQPSVRQLWMAVASRGIAYHFNYDPGRRQWWDDKNQGIEAETFLKKFLREDANLELVL